MGIPLEGLKLAQNAFCLDKKFLGKSYSSFRLKIDLNGFFIVENLLGFLSKKWMKMSFLSFIKNWSIEFFRSFAWSYKNIKAVN